MQRWNVLIIWECQTKNSAALDALLIDATLGRANQRERFDRPTVSPTQSRELEINAHVHSWC